MENIEKVKRILDAGHWVKVTHNDNIYDVLTITSYTSNDCFSYIRDLNDAKDIGFGRIEHIERYTIEVIQRIPTAYKAGDKVLVLSNPSPTCSDSKLMVGKIGTIKSTDGFNYSVYNEDRSDYFYFPNRCLAPAFDDEKDTNLKLSGKEVTVTIDGKEYTAVIK